MKSYSSPSMLLLLNSTRKQRLCTSLIDLISCSERGSSAGRMFSLSYKSTLQSSDFLFLVPRPQTILSWPDLITEWSEAAARTLQINCHCSFHSRHSSAASPGQTIAGFFVTEYCLRWNFSKHLITVFCFIYFRIVWQVLNTGAAIGARGM